MMNAMIEPQPKQSAPNAADRLARTGWAQQRIGLIAAALPQKGTLSGTEISEIKLMVTMLATATERRGRLIEPSSFTPTTLPQHWVRT
jgi:hypothetical protein